MPVDKIQKAKLKEKYQDEKVFVIPHILLAGIENKFTRMEHTQGIWSKYDTLGKFVFRYDTEGDSALQQLIPYIVVQHPEKDMYFVSKRKEQSGEPRLVGQMSLGFGGHINPEDGFKDILFKALYRELNEELFIEPLSSAQFVGYVRDMSSSTGDHTGCVFVVQAKDVQVKEIDKLDGLWLTFKELEDGYFKFENWSKHIIDYLVVNKGKF